MDLHEGYIELVPNLKRGFGAVVGRQMLTYGEGRSLGTVAREQCDATAIPPF